MKPGTGKGSWFLYLKSEDATLKKLTELVSTDFPRLLNRAFKPGDFIKKNAAKFRFPDSNSILPSWLPHLISFHFQTVIRPQRSDF